ncbi:hypothetical protein GCM10027066_21330 [Dyella jejuensis]
MLLLGATGCRRAPDEAQIRQAIEMAVQATAKGDASAVVDPLTSDFDGNHGVMSREDLGNLLRVAKLRGETLHAAVGTIDVLPRGERYVADFTVTLARGGTWLPAQWDVYKVETAWRREGRDWRCYEATWVRQF